MNPLTNQQIIEMVPAVGAINPHHNVSSRYSFIPTYEAIDILRDTGWQPIAAKQCGVRKEERVGFQKHMIRFKYLTDLQTEMNREERIDLVLYNSHDRGCAFNLMASIWRKVCGNGLMVSSNLLNFKHRHIGFNQNEFIESANKIASHAGLIAERINEFKSIDLENGERTAFAQVAINYAYGENSPIVPAKVLYERRYDDNGKDLWTTYNVIQENIMKGGSRYFKRDSNNRLRRGTTRKIKSLDRDIKLNKALWSLTERMAELKGSQSKLN